jgi:SAM-dependent methyltransferase
MPIINSEDYHDYVFKNGRLIGEMDQMYQKAKDIPWHQDKEPDCLDFKIALRILETKAPYDSILEIGCGLGYLTNEVAKYCKNEYQVVGTDISPTAIDKARKLFPNLRFEVLDITKDLYEQGWGEMKYSLVFVRGLFWYVFPGIKKGCDNIVRLIDKRGYLLVQQNFPPLDTNFVGKEVLPNPEALLSYFRPDIQESVVNYLEDNKENPVNDNWVYMFGRRRQKD